MLPEGEAEIETDAIVDPDVMLILAVSLRIQPALLEVTV
jgi:hypothetical protein